MSQSQVQRARGSTPPLVEQEAQTVEVRVLEKMDELVASYRLRYEVYGALGYIERNRAGLELDPYDPYAIPFGAFDRATGALVGTLRLVTQRPQAGYVQAVCQLLDESADADLIRQAARPRPHPLPSLISELVAARVAAYNTGHFVVEELSRTIVRPGHRGAGVSRRLMELGLAWASQRAPRVLVGACLGEHVAMYARYGYQALDGSVDRFDSVGQLARAVVCRTDRLPQPTRDNVDQLLPELHAAAARRLPRMGRS